MSTSQPTRHTVIPAVHLVLWRDGQVLLARRSNTGYEDGNYSVPAGHADAGETVWQAMVREAQEEVALDLTTAAFEQVHVMHRYSPEQNQAYLSQGGRPHFERVDFFFLVKDWAGQPVIAEPHKCDELLWSDPEFLPTNVIPYVATGLDRLLAGQTYSEFGWNESSS